MDLKNWCNSKSGNITLLAEAVGVKPQFISMVISGRRLLPLNKIVIASAVTGIPARELRPDVFALFVE